MVLAVGCWQALDVDCLADLVLGEGAEQGFCCIAVVVVEKLSRIVLRAGAKQSQPKSRRSPRRKSFVHSKGHR